VQGGAGGQGPDLPGAAQTDAERTAAANRRMDESLGTFDEEIRKERERLARERDANASGDSGAAGEAEDESGSGGEGEGQGSKSGGSEESGSSDSGGAEGNSDGGMRSEGSGGTGASGGGGTGSGGSKGSGPSTAPKNIPDGRDDDVIARQIREAAEKETDPELREKLWQEYVEYKKNVQGK